jgi:hypothetical protein
MTAWALLAVACLSGGTTGLTAALYPPMRLPFQNLVIEGRPVATIVLADPASAVERQAAAELAEQLKAISGATLAITNQACSNSVCLHLGASARARLDWPKIRSGLSDDGFVIRTLPEGLAIAGDSDLGTLYGVYAFLEEGLGVRWLMPGNHGTVAPPRTTVQIGMLDRRETPSFRFRWIGNDAWALHNRCNVNLTVAGQRAGVTWQFDFHSFADVMPRSECGRSHPEYYSLVNGQRSNLPGDKARRGWQLCTSNPQLVEEYARRINARLDRDPGIRVISISPNDGGQFCECTNCRALDRPDPDWYARYSDRLAVFNNAVARRVRERHPEVLVKGGAYGRYLRVPADPDYRMEPNQAVQACHTYACYNHPVADDQCAFNKDCFRTDLEKWAKLTPHLFIYEYYQKGAWAGLPWPIVHSVRKDLPYYQRLGVEGFYSQYTADAFPSSAVVLYVAVKLAWNVNLEVDELLADYYQACYQEAAEPMRRYHERLERAMTAYGNHVSPYKYQWPSLCAPDIFTDKVMTEAEHDLAEAGQRVRDAGARERLQRDRVNLDYLRRALDYFKAIGEPFRGVTWSDKAAWERAKADAARIGETKLGDIRQYLEAHGRRLPQALVVHDRPDRIYGVGKPPQRPAE